MARGFVSNHRVSDGKAHHSVRADGRNLMWCADNCATVAAVPLAGAILSFHGFCVFPAGKSWLPAGWLTMMKFCGAIIVAGLGRRDPVGRRQIGVLSQIPAGGRQRPGDDCRVVNRMDDQEQRRTRRLNGGDQIPGGAGEVKTASGHGWWIGDLQAGRATHGIGFVAAGTATAGNFEPVDRVGLTGNLKAESRKTEKQKNTTPSGRGSRAAPAKAGQVSSPPCFFRNR